MSRELCLKLGRPIEEISRGAVDLALDVGLIALDLNHRASVSSRLGKDHTELSHVLLDFDVSDIGVRDVVGSAEIRQALGLASQTCLNLKDVEKGLAADLTGMRAKEDVLAGLSLHLVGKCDGFLEVKVLEKSLSESGKAIRVVSLLTEDEREGDGLKGIALKEGELNARLVGLRSGLVVGAAQEEGSNHVSHEVLGAELNDVQVTISKVHSIGEKSGKHAVGVLGGEREDKRPVQQPTGLVEHTHRTLSETGSDHILNLTDGSEFGALTRFLELDLAGEKSPEDLGNELVVRVGLSSKDFLEDEEVVMGQGVILGLEQELRVVKEVLAILDGDLVDTLAKSLEIELTVFAHFGDILVVLEQVDELSSGFLSLSNEDASLLGVGGDQFRLDLVLEGLGLGTDVGVQKEEEEMRVQERSQFLDLL